MSGHEVLGSTAWEWGLGLFCEVGGRFLTCTQAECLGPELSRAVQRVPQRQACRPDPGT